MAQDDEKDPKDTPAAGPQPPDDGKGETQKENPWKKIFAEGREKREREEQERARRAQRALPEASLAFQARRGGRVATRYYDRHTGKELGIRITQLDVLAAVATTQDPSVRRVAARIDVASCTLSRSVRRLEDRGLLYREADTMDRRRRFLRLTAAGRDLVERGEHLVHQVPQRRAIASLTHEHIVRVRGDSIRMAEFFLTQIRSERWVDRNDPKGLWEWDMRWAGATQQEVWDEYKRRNEERMRERREREGPGGSG